MHEVYAHPERCKVHTRQTGKVTWEASGTFMGEHLSVKARSEMSAVRQWQDIAEFRYRSS